MGGWVCVRVCVCACPWGAYMGAPGVFVAGAELPLSTCAATHRTACPPACCAPVRRTSLPHLPHLPPLPPPPLPLAAPIKIFGDLHGQFGDLMRLFEEYGTPSTAGDITYIDYLVSEGVEWFVVCGVVCGVWCGVRHHLHRLPGECVAVE